VPFLATRTVERYGNELDRLRCRLRTLHRFALPALITVPLGVAVLLTWGGGQTHLLQLRWTLPLALAFLLVIHLGPYVWRDRGALLPRPTFAVRGAAQLVLATLLLLNAAAPYLGGKTITAFTMYSNLTTEGGTSNHLFLPRLAVATSQDDLIEILESEDPYLAWIAEEDLRLTWHELRREMTQNPDAPIVYRRDGETIRLAAASEDPELISTHPIWHRLIAHREIAPDGRCFW
jgi:hypothetical protein